MSGMIPFSILDLSPIAEGSNASASFRNTLDLAQHGERWGYQRYWLAEHHGMPGIASAATAVVMAHVAGGTKTIRVGAGGIMLPNHAPLVIAEQFGTLDAARMQRFERTEMLGDHQRRVVRQHDAEPRAAGDRRAVRYARSAASGPHRAYRTARRSPAARGSAT